MSEDISSFPVVKDRSRHTKPTRESFRILAVIPTLGQRLESLELTLASIRDQTGVQVDTVIVTKTKSENLRKLSDRFGVSLVCHGGNISAALNAGFLLPAADAHRYAFWIGDDDLLRPDSLKFASDLLERNHTAVLCYGDCDYVDGNGALLFSRRPPPLAPLLLQFVPGLIKQESCLFRKSALIKVGGLDESLRYTMDLDLLLRLRRLGPFVKVLRVQSAFCWHPGSLTVSNRNASLVEAQMVQLNNAHGALKLLLALMQRPIRWLILALSWNINRNLKAT